MPGDYAWSLIKSLVDGMPIFAAILSPGGITLRLNENVVKITDAPLVELLNVPFGSAFWWNYSPEIMSRVENSLAQARQGQGSRFEIAARISQHVFITVDYTLTPVLDDKGKVLYLFACGTDISANKRNEAALRDSEEMLALATESAEVGIWSLNFLTNELIWSDLHKKMWGYEAYENLMYEDWHRPIHPDDVQEAFRQVEKARLEGSRYLADYRIRRVNDGEERWIRSTGRFFYDANHQPFKLTGVSYDITREKQTGKALRDSENLFRGTMMNIPDGFMIFESVRDADGAIVDFKWLHVNPAAEKIVGRSASYLTGKKLLEEMPGNKDTGLFDAYVRVTEQGEVFQQEFEYTADNLDHFFLTRAVKLNDGFAVVFSDITMRKRFEKELERKVAERTTELIQANRQLELKNKELEQFAFITSHDLQEPLRKIQVFSSMLYNTGKEALDERNLSHLEKIMSSAQNMRNFINDLLEFSKISHSSEHLTPVDLNQEFNHILQAFELRIAEEQVEIEIEPLPPVLGVAWQLNVLFSNLLANSMKFVAPGVQPRIRISAGPVQADELTHFGLKQDSIHYVKVTVTDNGIGFEQEYAAEIFSMFKRLHDKKQYEGTGIGLAMCAKIAALHGGAIKAYSTPGNGARMEVVLTAPAA